MDLISRIGECHKCYVCEVRNHMMEGGRDGSAEFITASDPNY